jgi:hypothetical protein
VVSRRMRECAFGHWWLLARKLRRSMIEPIRKPLEDGRRDRSSGNALSGRRGVLRARRRQDPRHRAVEGIDRDINKAKPRCKHPKYLDTRSGRFRLAAITEQFRLVDPGLRQIQSEGGRDAPRRRPCVLSGVERATVMTPASSARWRRPPSTGGTESTAAGRDMEVLALTGTLRKRSIDRIMGMSDLELGLQALLGNRSSSGANPAHTLRAIRYRAPLPGWALCRVTPRFLELH